MTLHTPFQEALSPAAFAGFYFAGAVVSAVFTHWLLTIAWGAMGALCTALAVHAYRFQKRLIARMAIYRLTGSLNNEGW